MMPCRVSWRCPTARSRTARRSKAPSRGSYTSGPIRPPEPERYLLHKRDKGDPGTDLKSLVYVRSIQLGAKALEEGKRKAAGPASRKASAASGKGQS